MIKQTRFYVENQGVYARSSPENFSDHFAYELSRHLSGKIFEYLLKKRENVENINSSHIERFWLKRFIGGENPVGFFYVLCDLAASRLESGENIIEIPPIFLKKKEDWWLPGSFIETKKSFLSFIDELNVLWEKYAILHADFSADGKVAYKIEIKLV